VKRAFDLVFALTALIAVTPVIAIAAVFIKADSPGPIIYRASRVGRRGQLFVIYKLRTMAHAPSDRHAGITTAGDSRITRVGHFLRRSKIDELPQLLNVVLGEMSIVGPRPEDPHYVSHYSEAERVVLRVKPGLTSPASIAFSREAELLAGDNWQAVYLSEVMPRKLALDLDYVNNMSVSRDLGIISKTVVTLIREVLGDPRS